MSNETVIENKISSVRKYLNILQRYRNRSANEFRKDIDLQGATERYLYLVIQATIDLGEAIIAYKKFRKPAFMAETFSILREEGIIDTPLEEQMGKMTGFRNIIAHDYSEIDYDIVHDILNDDVNDIEKFLKKIESYVAK